MNIPADVFMASQTIVKWLTHYTWEENDEHMGETPMRFLRGLMELTNQDPDDARFTTFLSDHDEMVVCQDIPFVTLCAHHLLPFIGKAHVAYIPNGKIVGLSKIPRLVRYMSRKPNVQEELTEEIAGFMEKALEPKGIAVFMEAEHLCASIRGVQVNGMTTKTSKMTGVFLDPAKGARQEFLQLLGAH